MTAAPRLLRGRYEPGPVAGAGGQGEVRRARDVRHDRTVAIKIREDAAPEVFAEARVLYDLRPHPSLPLLRDDFTEDGRLHLVMDWVEGRDLAETIRDDGPLTLSEAEEVLRAVAEALDHMHGHDPPVAHGDVKPANVVCAADGRVVLVDLGLAGAGGTGTRGWRAPEASSGRAGPAADIYSLAATAYTLLTGQAPAPGPFAPMPGVPAGQAGRVRRAVEWGLQTDPARRPRSASALVDALAGTVASHNLPSPISSFVGRAGELARLDDLLRSRRLVTVVGPGGAGKTRLAVEAAARVCDFAGGVVYADLVGIRGGVLRALLRAMGVRDPGDDPAEAAVRTLGRTSRLVVLDNAEHLLDEVADACAVLTAHCPRVGVLVTSREALGIPGEAIVRIGGLSSGGGEAEELLLARIAEADPSAAITNADRDAAAAVAARLEGLPLALELAAARAAQDGLPAVAAAVGERLDALGVLRGRPAHHRTIAAMVDHSYELLDEATQSVLRAASVLAGGADPAVLAEIAGRGAGAVEAALARAAAASMAEGGPERLRLLEPVRLRLGEHLAEAGEEAACRDRLGGYAARFFADAATRLNLRYDAGLLAAFEREERNLLEGLRVVLARGPNDRVLAGACAAYLAADRRADALALLGGLREERRAAGGDLSPRALGMLARHTAMQGLAAESARLVEEALAAARAAGDEAAAVEALLGRAFAPPGLDRDAALAALDEAESLLAERDDPALRAVVATTRGKTLMELGRLDDARASFAGAAALAAEHDFTSVEGTALAYRIIIESNAGNEEESRRILDELFAHARRHGSTVRLAEASNALGHWHAKQGDLAAAEAAYRDAFDAWSRVRDTRAEWVARVNIGSVLLETGRHHEAEQELMRSLDWCLGAGEEENAAAVTILLSRAAAASGRIPEAIAHAGSAVEVFRRSAQQVYLGHALRALAEAQASWGDLAAAREAALEAKGLYVGLGYTTYVKAADFLLERLADGKCKPDVAESN